MTICVASTIPSHKPAAEQVQWLHNRKVWSARGDIVWFAVLQDYGRPDELSLLRGELDRLDATVWSLSIDGGEDEVSNDVRIRGIVTGRNLVHEYVNLHSEITHLLFLDSDVRVPPDLIDRLLELNHPITGGNVLSYGLEGVPVTDRASWHDTTCPRSKDRLTEADLICTCGASAWDVQSHDLQTAGCLLMTREVTNAIRWGWSRDRGMTDDPWTEDLAEKLGFGKVWVRHDVSCLHLPQVLLPLEHRGLDLGIRR